MVSAAESPGRLSILLVAVQLRGLWGKVQQSGLSRTLGWALGAALASQSLNIANSILLARLLGADGFGQYSLILMTVAIGSSVGSFGLGVTATRFVASERGQGGARLRVLVGFISSVALLASLVCGLLLLLLAPLLAAYVTGGTGLEIALSLSALYLVGSSVDLVMMGLLAGFERFRTLLITGLIKGGAAVMLCFLLTRALGLSGAVTGMGIVSVMGAALNFAAIRRTLPARSASSAALGPGERRQLLSFSLPVMLASLLVNPSTWLGSVMVSRLPGGTVLLAEFAVVRNWMIVLQFFPVQIAQAMLPFLSRMRVQPGGSRDTSRWSILLVALIAVVLAITTFPVGLWFTRLYGLSSPSLTLSFFLIVGASVVAALNTMVGHVVMSNGRSWPRLVADLAIAVSFVLLVYWLTAVRQLGAVALASATAVSLLVGAAVIGAFYLFSRDRRERLPGDSVDRLEERPSTEHRES